MTTTSWHIAVLIPARDEQDLLPCCLQSILDSILLLPPDVTVDIIVVCDSSTDRTVDIANEMINSDHLQTRGLVVESAAGCVGTARALAAQLALDRYSGPLDRCWLANTDADCQVPSTWLLNQLAIAESGVSAVAGIIAVDSFAGHKAFVPESFRRSYLIHPDGTHPHVHGANLGIRADAYEYAGGWRNLSTAEDHDLWQRLRRTPHKRIADASLCVTTSGRRVGRAPQGFADALSAHNFVGTSMTEPGSVGEAYDS